MSTAQLVVALDTHDSARALALAEALQGTAPWLKVGLELFIHAGPAILTQLKDLGFKVFLDLKMYDIPNTVRGGVLAAAAAGADMLTIHTQGGGRMAQAAVQAAAEAGDAAGHSPIVLGVTVLTSMEQGELPLHDGPLDEVVLRLAEDARRWGLHGVVCSGHEAAAIKSRCGANFVCLTPGIRPVLGKVDDQRRVMTPEAAILAGADYLVVGRPITMATDPAAAALSILDAMQRTKA